MKKRHQLGATSAVTKERGPSNLVRQNWLQSWGGSLGNWLSKAVL